MPRPRRTSATCRTCGRRRRSAASTTSLQVASALERVPRAEADHRPEAPFLHHGTSPARGGRRRTLRRRTTDRRRVRGPCARGAARAGVLPAVTSTELARVEPRGSLETGGPGDRAHGRGRARAPPACDARRLGAARARRRPRSRTARTGRPPSARAAFAASATASPPWPSRDAGPDDAGPDRADDRGEPGARAHASAEATPTHATSPSTHAPAATATSTRPRSFSARTASDSETGSAPPGTCTYATRTPSPMPAHTGASWLWSEQQTTGIPPSDSASVAVLLAVADGGLERRVRQLHHVRARLDGRLESARQVRVQDVEARPSRARARAPGR